MESFDAPLHIIQLVVAESHSRHHNRIRVGAAIRVTFFFLARFDELSPQPHQAPLPEQSSHRIVPSHASLPEEDLIASLPLLQFAVEHFAAVLLAFVVEVLQAKTDAWEPKQQIVLFRAVDVEGSLLQNQREALPRLQLSVAFLQHRLGNFAEHYSFDVLHQI